MDSVEKRIVEMWLNTEEVRIVQKAKDWNMRVEQFESFKLIQNLKNKLNENN